MNAGNADDDSSMAKTIKDCKNKTPDERAAYLESWSDLESVHTKVAQGGQSRVSPPYSVTGVSLMVPAGTSLRC
jgi:hypothetical protein